jgi:hypothetical protein
MLLIFIDECHSALLHEEQFTLVVVIVQGRSAAGWSDFGPESEHSFGLRAGKMEDNFFAKGVERLTVPRSKEEGMCLRVHSMIRLSTMLKFDKVSYPVHRTLGGTIRQCRV